MNQTELRERLERHRVRPNKKRGQNFLVDQNIFDKIIRLAAVGPDDDVLEVGVGPGTLTLELLSAGARVIGVEADEALVPVAAELLGESPFMDRFELLMGDVLHGTGQLDPRVVEACRARGKPIKVVSNLPYQVATPLLVNLVVQPFPLASAVVMVQKEVADRILATTIDKQYGAPSLLIQAMVQAERLADVSPACFWPMPRVSSSLLGLSPRPDALDPATFERVERFTRAVFGNRRKQMAKVLRKAGAIEPEATFEALGVRTDARVEMLDPGALLTLARQCRFLPTDRPSSA